MTLSRFAGFFRCIFVTAFAMKYGDDGKVVNVWVYSNCEFVMPRLEGMNVTNVTEMEEYGRLT